LLKISASPDEQGRIFFTTSAIAHFGLRRWHESAVKREP
jgi:hypothetical protein